MLCILTGGKVIALAVTGFTLSWDHSVQHIEWWERWQVSDRGLRPVEARVTGSGAGIDLPPDAVWKSDGWHYQPRLPWQKSVHLGASGATRGGGWTLCPDDADKPNGAACLILGATPEADLHLQSAPDCDAAAASVPQTAPEQDQ